MSTKLRIRIANILQKDMMKNSLAGLWARISGSNSRPDLCHFLVYGTLLFTLLLQYPFLLRGLNCFYGTVREK